MVLGNWKKLPWKSVFKKTPFLSEARPVSAQLPALRRVYFPALRGCSTPLSPLLGPLLRCHGTFRIRSILVTAQPSEIVNHSSWDAQWEAFTSILEAKGFGTSGSSVSGQGDWGGTKRAVLGFARLCGEEALSRLNCPADVADLTTAPIGYTDRKVKNARLRLLQFSGTAPSEAPVPRPVTPRDVSSYPANVAAATPASSSGGGDIGRASFQDVCRLLMAVHLEGAARQPETEAAGSRVLQHVCQMAQDSAQAPPTPPPSPEHQALPTGASPGTEYRRASDESGGRRRKGRSRQHGSDTSSSDPRDRHGLPRYMPRGPWNRPGGHSIAKRWKRAEDLPESPT